MKKSLRILATGFILASLTVSLTACKPYDKPEYVTVEPNQTAFIIPLEGQTSEQGQFQSEDYLKNAQVATKRIQVEHRWSQTGRMSSTGEWIPKVRVILIDRNPETREWTNDTDSGTSDKKQGFDVESVDSIKFTANITSTSQILEEDAAKFLYQYNGKQLKEIMDTEIRNNIGTALVELYGKMSIDEIRRNKDVVIQKVRDKVIPYFKGRGITITNIGYSGDFTYSKELQDSINAKFSAEQKQQAQAIINQTQIEQAKAEAEANNIKAESMKQNMQEQIELKKLELQKQWNDRWDGHLPTNYFAGNNDSQPLIQIPMNQTTTPSK